MAPHGDFEEQVNYIMERIIDAVNFFAEDEGGRALEVGFEGGVVYSIEVRGGDIVLEAEDLVPPCFELAEVGNYIIR